MATKQLNEKINTSTRKEKALKKEVEKWMLKEWGQRCPDYFDYLFSDAK